jgi:hypothetical protein
MPRTAIKTVKKTRITKSMVAEHRASSKRDNSPRWEDCEKMTADEFSRHWRYAMEYYRLEFNAKDLKPKVIDWMGKVGYDKDIIKEFKKTKDTRCNSTMGGLAACLLRGMPEVRADFNYGRNSADWLRKAIQNAINEGGDDIDEEEVAKAKKEVKVEVYVPSIQDRLREAAGNMTEELDVAIDKWIADPDSFDPKEFKVASLFRSKGVKPAHARLIKGFYNFGYTELQELASGNGDDQLREAYSHVARKNVRKLLDFYQSIMDACDQIGAEAKLNKKPRAKKVKPAEDLVKKLKFCKTDDSLGIVSVPPAQIIGSKEIWIYNTKTRKLGKYVANEFQELSVKGTSVVNFNESTSVQKTMRKPAEQLKAFKDLNTQKRMETWFEKDVKTTDIKLNGRFNEDIVILKVYK